MRKLKKSLTFSSIILLLILEVLAIPVFSLTLKQKFHGADFPEAETSDEKPIYQKGMSYSAWSGNAFSSPESNESLRLLTETNAEWIAINFAWAQTNTTSHDIHVDPNRTATTSSVEHAISTAHSLGLKVMLKPMVDTLEREKTQGYPTVWRGMIQPSKEWFESYSDFINSFAEIAEQNNVELFSVGCELKATTGEKELWENVIAGVRERYSGPVTYSADWTNYRNIEWWDSVDYVGIDAYFPLTFKNDPSSEELKKAWTYHADEIENWISTINKAAIFTEIGYRSGDGTNRIPSNFWSEMTVDLQEQRDCYEAAFQALWNRSWFYGFYWWTWIHDPQKGGPDDPNHTPQNKPAQDVVTNWYSLDRQIAVIDQTFTSADKSSINGAQSVGFHVSWEHNSTDVVNAKLYVNGTEHITNGTGWASFRVAYETVGNYSWDVTDLQHPEANSYKRTVKSPHIVWDKVVLNVDVDSTSFGVSKVRVEVAQAYDGASVTGATTSVNGRLCEEIEPGVYAVEIDSLSPFLHMTVETDLSDLVEETWTGSTVHVMNLMLYIALVAAVMVVLLVFFKLRKHGSIQPIESTN